MKCRLGDGIKKDAKIVGFIILLLLGAVVFSCVIMVLLGIIGYVLSDLQYVLGTNVGYIAFGAALSMSVTMTVLFVNVIHGALITIKFKGVFTGIRKYFIKCGSDEQ